MKLGNKSLEDLLKLVAHSKNHKPIKPKKLIIGPSCTQETIDNIKINFPEIKFYDIDGKEVKCPKI